MRATSGEDAAFTFSSAPGMGMTELRHLSVYRLSGIPYRFLAVEVDGGAFFLYDAEVGIDVLPCFVVKADGRLRFNFGTETQWTTADLEEVGEDFSREP
jgi:hypothetical protein